MTGFACRICGCSIEPFMSFGAQPVANGFVDANEIQNEEFFELAPAWCSRCGMVQLKDQPSPTTMFHDQYAFFSRTSKRMGTHFKEFASSVQQRYLADKQDPLVLELGSNDGILLEHFARAGVRHLGIEPSANVAAAAGEAGVETWVEFFSESLARKIVHEKGRAAVVLAANVMCHIPDLPMMARGIRMLLDENGVFIFEDPYLGDVLQKTSYDQFYDEHVFLFCARSVQSAFVSAGLELIEVAPQGTHGGSMRYTLAPQGSKPVCESVERQLTIEGKLGLDEQETYTNFKGKCEKSRTAFKGILDELIQSGHRVTGYGATSKSTTVLNYCGITPEYIEYISDTTPGKQGKMTPGTHIPVVSPDEFHQTPPDVAVLFAWNHQEEIWANEKAFEDAGGRWLVYVPEVKLL
jgi:methylation protein EvaC